MISQEKRVVITGISSLAAVGLDKTVLWESILRGKTGLRRKDYCVEGVTVNSAYVHEIKGFDITKYGIEKKFLSDIETWKQEKKWVDLSYLLAVTKSAIDDGRLDYNRDDNTIGLILTHENPGLDEFYMDVFQVFINEMRKKKTGGIKKNERFFNFFKGFKKKAYDLQTFMFLYHVSKVFGIHGYSLFLNNACASGLYAIETASDIIRSGKCSVVIVASADQASVFKQMWFEELGMYPKDGKIKPFAENRDGFVLGDGGAGLVLESLDNALKRKAHIYAEYLGGGFSSEGWKVSIPDMVSNSYATAIETALKNSGVRKEEIDLIVPHGVGTKVTDAYEAKAITGVFGRNFEKPLVTAFKPYLGHNLGCTALLEVVILLISLENDLILPTLNSSIIDRGLNISLITKLTKAHLRTVLKTACGFAGFNGAAIFRKTEEI